MATYFVRSSGGNDANGGTAWDDAKATVLGASGAMSVATSNGDIVVVDYQVSESVAGPKTLSGGAIGNPKVMISAEQQSSGTSVVYHAGAILSVTNEVFYVVPEWDIYGMTLKTNSQYYALRLTQTNGEGRNRYYGCQLEASQSFISYSGGNKVLLYGCTVISAKAAGDALEPIFNLNGWFEMHGGSVTATGTSNASPGPLAKVYDQTYHVAFHGVDLSALEDIVQLVAYQSSYDYGISDVVFSGCKLPSGWTLPTIITGGIANGILVERSSSAVRTQTAAGLIQYKVLNGSVTHDTGTYRTGGANDGDDDYSWKMVGDASYCSYYQPLVTPPITAWCAGDNVTAHTITIHFGSDTALTDQNIWFDILYPAETTTHQDGFNSTRGVVGAAGNAHTTGDAWTDDTAGTFLKYKKSWTITPDFPGPIQVRAHLAGNLTAYVCPKLDIT